MANFMFPKFDDAWPASKRLTLTALVWLAHTQPSAPEMTAGDVQEITGLSSSVTASALAQLARDGVIARRAAFDDRERKVVLYATFPADLVSEFADDAGAG